MRNFIMALSALAITAPVMVAAPSEAGARERHYKGKTWRGKDGRTYCRRSNGTTGLLVGGVAGALIGREIDGGNDRTAGTLIGAAAGALAGREIDRSSSGPRCR